MTINLTVPSSLTSWKTSLSGIVLGALGFFQAYQIHDWHKVMEDPTTLGLFAAAVLGLNAKDGNVTGGSVGQPSTAAALTASNVQHSAVNPPAGAPAA